MNLLYIAGPYADPDPAVRALNVARAMLLHRAAVCLGYAPISVHATIAAGGYGSDEVPHEREAGLRASLGLARWVAESGGGCWAVERDDGTLSEGTATEVALFADVGGPLRFAWCDWRKMIPHLAMYKWPAADLSWLAPAWDALEVGRRKPVPTDAPLTERLPLTPEQEARAWREAVTWGSADPLHPRGRCTCGGNGRCPWHLVTAREEAMVDGIAGSIELLAAGDGETARLLRWLAGNIRDYGSALGPDELPPPLWPNASERIADMLDAVGIPRTEFSWHDGSDEALSLQDRVALLIERAGARADLPPPTGNGRPVLPDVLALPGLTDAARAIIEAQAAKGQAKYGRPLRYDDGRGIADAQQEAADLVCYLVRERGADSPLVTAAVALLVAVCDAPR